MNKDDEKVVEKLKEEYKKINPNSDLSFVVKNAIKKAKKQKSKKYGIASACAVLALAIILPNVNPRLAMAMSRIPVISQFVSIVTLNKYSDNDSNITAETPSIENANKNESISNLNEEIDKYVKTLITTFKNDFSIGDNKSLDITYEVLSNNENMLSLQINGLETAASGYNFSKVYHINKQTNKIITLKDIFKDDVDYVKILSDNVRNQMEEQMKNDESVSYFLNTTPADSNFKEIDKNQNFYFDENNNLVLSFDEYSVAPGYMGIVEFTIPKEITKDITNTIYQ